MGLFWSWANLQLHESQGLSLTWVSERILFQRQITMQEPGCGINISERTCILVTKTMMTTLIL